MISEVKHIFCRIERVGDEAFIVRLPRNDICRIHMQFLLLRAEKLHELLLCDESGGESIVLDMFCINAEKLDLFIRLLEQGFLTCGDISWMHIDTEISINSREADIAAGFFY